MAAVPETTGEVGKGTTEWKSFSSDRQKTRGGDGSNMTWRGSSFQTRAAAATGIARSPTVDKRVRCTVTMMITLSEDDLERYSEFIQSNLISHCSALHSNVAARNLCINFVAFSSRDQPIVYMYTLVCIAISLPLYILSFAFVALLSLLYFTTICGE